MDMDKKLDKDAEDAVLDKKDKKDVEENMKYDKDYDGKPGDKEDEVKEADEDEKVDMKKGDEEDEIDTDDVKKESYQDRDQPKVKDDEKSEKEVPGNKLSVNKDKPFLKANAKLAKEAVAKMFKDAPSLSEGFMGKAATIFEAAFNASLQEAADLIEETYKEQFDVQYATLEKSLSEKVDNYLNYVVEEWVDQNEVAVTESIRSEIAENFLSDFKDLFEKHNISIPEGKVDLLEETSKELAETKAEVNALTESIMEKNAQLFEGEKSSVITDLSEGLAETQVEKLKTLVEDIEAKDIEAFTEKAKIIAEAFVGTSSEKTPLNEGTKVLVEGELSKKDKGFAVDSGVARYIASAKIHNFDKISK